MKQLGQLESRICRTCCEQRANRQQKSVQYHSQPLQTIISNLIQDYVYTCNITWAGNLPRLNDFKELSFRFVRFHFSSSEEPDVGIISRSMYLCRGIKGLSGEHITIHTGTQFYVVDYC